MPATSVRKAAYKSRKKELKSELASLQKKQSRKKHIFYFLKIPSSVHPRYFTEQNLYINREGLSYASFHLTHIQRDGQLLSLRSRPTLRHLFCDLIIFAGKRWTWISAQTAWSESVYQRSGHNPTYIIQASEHFGICITFLNNDAQGIFNKEESYKVLVTELSTGWHNC